MDMFVLDNQLYSKTNQRPAFRYNLFSCLKKGFPLESPTQIITYQQHNT